MSEIWFIGERATTSTYNRWIVKCVFEDSTVVMSCEYCFWKTYCLLYHKKIASHPRGEGNHEKV
jgi:hypothetical protein